jgi:hypothetical protein
MIHAISYLSYMCLWLTPWQKREAVPLELCFTVKPLSQKVRPETEEQRLGCLRAFFPRSGWKVTSLSDVNICCDEGGHRMKHTQEK